MYPTVVCEPAILYVGTPVVLVSTVNEDGTANLAPMSSAWWLGWGCTLGLTESAHTVANLRRTGECVLNLPSADQASAVDRLAMTTGASPVPQDKQWLRFEHEPDKFGRSGLTPRPGVVVAAPRAAECPLQLEAVVERILPFGETNPMVPVPVVSVELRIVKVHAHAAILMDGLSNRIDPDRWRPLIMSFRQYYGLGPQVRPSRLASSPEDLWRPAAVGMVPAAPDGRVTSPASA